MGKPFAAIPDDPFLRQMIAEAVSAEIARRRWQLSAFTLIGAALGALIGNLVLRLL